jgi:hypothetical protein
MNRRGFLLGIAALPLAALPRSRSLTPPREWGYVKGGIHVSDAYTDSVIVRNNIVVHFDEGVYGVEAFQERVAAALREQAR